MTFHLCAEGVRLYMIWSAVKLPKSPEARTAKAEYYAHRASCPECTKPEDDEREQH